MEISTIAHCFIARADWPEWVRINPDVPAGRRYDAFLKELDQLSEHMAAEGGRTVQVDVDPGKFVLWCQETGRDVDAGARAAYAAVRLIENERERN